MLTVIINPTAASGDAAKLHAPIKARLELSGRTYQILTTAYPGHATELAKMAVAQAECEGVISVGGDGTLLETASGMVNSNKPLGIIPAGTGNDFIKTVGTPADPMEALDFILTHEPRPVDIGQVNDRMFLNVSGTGFDVNVLDETVRFKKHFKGLLPYMLGLFCAIVHYKPIPIILMADGQRIQQEVLICSFANGRYIGGGIPICKEAVPNDGYFDLVVVDHVPRWRIPFYLPALMRGKITQKSFTRHIRCKDFLLQSPNMRFNADGEVYLMDEARIQVKAGGLMLYW